MKIKLLFTSLVVLALTFSATAQNNLSDYWTQTTKNAVFGFDKINRSKMPKTALTYSINLNDIKSVLVNAPLRNANTKSNTIVNFPTATGKLEKFKIYDAPVMHPDLAARYPEIKSYVGYGINSSGLTVRFSLSPQKGLSAMITSSGNQTTFIEPYTSDLTTYTVYSRSSDDVRTETFECLTEDIPCKIKKTNNKDANDQTLRTFRLAMSATGEFTAYHGGTKPAALAAINATMTRVNGVYETDFAITMVLIANTDDVIYTDASTDPYSGGFGMNGELQSTLTSVITEANYDIGHLVHQESNSNGNAGCIGCVCVDGQKGSGFTSHVTPTGDDFDIDFVAHEMGHQFGGNHTFTHSTEGTGAQMEPGSGSTIMGYAGITGASDVQAHSDDYFHYFNIEQITNYVAGTGCQTNTTLVNAVPVSNAGADFTIPHSTAYILEGSGSDADAGDILTYCWEQGDQGYESKTSANNAPNSGMSPSYRSLPPTTSPNRYIPALSSVVAGNLTTQWETVITVGGAINMSLTVRDNANGSGQNHIDKMIVIVDSASGPFEVTSQTTNVTWTVAATETVTWNVANTTATPVNAANVDIYLSIDGGLSFWIPLAMGVPNTGSATVTVPWSTATTTARVMVRGSGNIFYAVNSSDFTVFSPTGISELENDNLSIYPNPTNGIINLEFNTNTKIDKITITDLHGKLVYSDKNLIGSSTQIDLSDFSNGIYMLQTQSKSEVNLFKVIKQ